MCRGIATLALLGLGSVFPALAVDPQAVAVIHPTKNNKVEGTVRFDWVSASQVRIVVDMKGLKPNSEHGFHIHEFGDVTANDGKDRDTGNLKSDANGNAHLELTMNDLALFGKEGILGRAVVIHADRDDFKTQPIAVGVIGLGK